MLLVKSVGLFVVVLPLAAHASFSLQRQVPHANKFGHITNSQKVVYPNPEPYHYYEDNSWNKGSKLGCAGFGSNKWTPLNSQLMCAYIDFSVLVANFTTSGMLSTFVHGSAPPDCYYGAKPSEYAGLVNQYGDDKTGLGRCKKWDTSVAFKLDVEELEDDGPGGKASMQKSMGMKKGNGLILINGSKPWSKGFGMSTRKSWFDTAAAIAYDNFCRYPKSPYPTATTTVADFCTSVGSVSSDTATLSTAAGQAAQGMAQCLGANVPTAVFSRWKTIIEKGMPFCIKDDGYPIICSEDRLKKCSEHDVFKWIHNEHSYPKEFPYGWAVLEAGGAPLAKEFQYINGTKTCKKSDIWPSAYKLPYTAMSEIDEDTYGNGEACSDTALKTIFGKNTFLLPNIPGVEANQTDAAAKCYNEHCEWTVTQYFQVTLNQSAWTCQCFWSCAPIECSGVDKCVPYSSKSPYPCQLGICE